MRKILLIIFCTFCLSVPVTVQAEENVTNQLDEILVQLENLDVVIQFLTDNQGNLEMFFDNNLDLRGVLDQIFYRVNQINSRLGAFVKNDLDSMTDDLDSIQADVSALSADLAVYMSQIVASVNGVTSEIDDLHQWLIAIGLDRIQYMLTQPQLDDSLNTFLSNFLSQLDFLDDYSLLLGQILQSIQEMDYSYQVEAALYNISLALDNLQNITVVIDLQEQLDNLDLNLDLDLGTALNRLETDLSSVLSSLDHISYVLQNFVYIFTDFKNDQELTNEELRGYLVWYRDYVFPGLKQTLTAQWQWLQRQEALEDAEAEFRDDLEQFLTDDATMPTDSEVPYVAQLEQAGLDEPEVPDDKIYSAVDSVETDLEDVELELTGALDIVDESFKGLLNSINLRWGSFNPVLSFSFNSPLKGSNSNIVFRYDFSKCELLPPCKAASTGVWGIILFVESFLAISATFSELIDN